MTEWLGSVLVVDDYEPNVRSVGALLAQAGFDVIPCFAGDEALQLAADEHPDLILLDWRMPAPDGRAVLQRLRAQPASAAIPVLILTADPSRDTLLQAFAEGAVDYLTKPFVAAELLARVRTQVALKRSGDRLQALASERQLGIERIAHDLRGHFGNILFASELLADSADPESRIRIAERIRSAAQGGLLFLQAVLEQARDPLGDASPLHPAEAIRSVVSAQRAHAEAKRIEIALRLDERLLLRGQPAAWTHVVGNLLSNAIKYAPPDSEVELELEAAPQRGLLRVLDRGPGIPANEQARLFRRFAPLSPQPSGHEGSTGLGLALARQHARAQGGELRYQDRPGGGACFVLEWPGV